MIQRAVRVHDCALYIASRYHPLPRARQATGNPDNTASRSDFAKKVGFSYLLGPKTTCSRILGAHHHRRPRKSESLSMRAAFTYTSESCGQT